MPCRYDDYEPSVSQSSYNQVLEDLGKARQQNDILTRYLCSLCTKLEDNNLEVLDKELALWWQLHKEEDKKREEKAKRAFEKGLKEHARSELLKSISKRLKGQLTEDEIEAIKKYGV